MVKKTNFSYCKTKLNFALIFGLSLALLSPSSLGLVIQPIPNHSDQIINTDHEQIQPESSDLQMSMDQNHFLLTYKLPEFHQTIVSTTEGGDYYDWRRARVNSTSAAVIGDHGNLSGLSDPDHPATAIYTSTTNFDGALSAADDTVQKALDTLDNAIAGTAHQHYELDLTFSGSNVWTVTDASVAGMQLADKDVYLNGLLNKDDSDYFTALVEGTKLTVTFAYNTYETDWAHVKFWKDETA